MVKLHGTTVAEKVAYNYRVDGDCWRWIGAHRRGGYGQIQVQGVTKSVHRIAYELWKSPIPEGLEIDHLCRVRDCINPDHLELVDHRENLRRMFATITHCPQGHEYVGSNIKIRRDGQRRCRTCINDYKRRWYKAKRDAKKVVDDAD